MKSLRCRDLVFFLQMLFVVVLFHVMSDSDVRGGYRVTLAVPLERIAGFVGRAYLMETNAALSPYALPGFRVALSVEDYVRGNGSFAYSCSLQVFLGDVKVWDSGHYSRFEVVNTCLLELTAGGDLQLRGPGDRVGWRTGTSGQGVERLQILRTGNLVLVDEWDDIKWQSFNFPTDVMLHGQRLNVAARLTSFPGDFSSLHYSFEIQEDKIALYLNSGKLKYSYWEFRPTKDRNITFVELGSKGLVLFNYYGRKIAQISPNPSVNLSIGTDPAVSPRFMSLNNRTGNLGLFYYSAGVSKFEAHFQALNKTCDLPTACKPYGICTFADSCSCIRDHGCNNEAVTTDGFCDGEDAAEMVAIKGVTSVIKDGKKRDNLSKDECREWCQGDCGCVATLFVRGECHHYGIVMGVKQVGGDDGEGDGNGSSYFVKVRKGTIGGGHGKSGLKRWALVLVGVVDGLIMLVVVGGIGWYYLFKRRLGLLGTNDT
ncbi:hypothetical protein MLD38_038391 [Melastoma candidum]|uniref:Uncharacterized protein n=1 Tax=Melastoma candidum TaxID=119954 RepID=A0ACB9KZS2_9MYRT|nr:hypothetical protein MLD38_038391 [Melastoma candidum]